MKLKYVSFLFLSALIISGCSTTGPVAAMQSQPERIEQLERDMQDVKSRVSALETMLSGNDTTNEVVIGGEGWESLASWRKLKTGMSYESVKKILGSAHRVNGGSIATWYYENGGYVTFMDGEVYQWTEPN